MNIERPYTITAATINALNSLSKEQSKFSAQFHKNLTNIDQSIFLQIKQADELQSVVFLANLLVGSPHITKAAASVISALLKKRPYQQLLRLDEECRHYSVPYREEAFSWTSLKPTVINDYRNQCQLLGLLSFHGNGWIRQAAIIALEDLDDKETIPFLLLRVNDWVEPVREKAWNAIRSKLSINHINIVVENLPVIEQLTNKQRANLTPLKEDIDKFLIQHCDELEDALSNQNFRIRRAIYSLIFRSEIDTKPSFAKKALNDKDPFIRLKTARYLQSEKNPVVLEKSIPVLIADNWYALRLCGLRISIEINHVKTDEILENLVLDRSKPVREAARFYLSKRSDAIKTSDFRQLYICAIKKGDNLLGALMGLGECGQPGDEKYAKYYLRSQRPKISSAALYAVASLSSSLPTELLLKALCNDHPRHSKVACKLLGDYSSQHITETCQKYLVNQDLPQHVRENAFRLLMNQSKWPKLITILTAVSMKIEISDLVKRQLELWVEQFNRSFFNPTDDEKVHIRKLLMIVEISDSQRAFIDAAI